LEKNMSEHVVDPATGQKGKQAKPRGEGGSSQVRKMFPPFYKVLAGGVNVDWTDKFTEAMSSFKNSSTLPKYVYELHGKSVRVVAYQPEAGVRPV
jgi:hypothetical protein